MPDYDKDIFKLLIAYFCCYTEYCVGIFLADIRHYNIRTCLAKQDQAGSYACGLQLNYDKRFNQGVWHKDGRDEDSIT